MFRTMTIVLAMAALAACSACNSVTGPMTSEDQTSVIHISQSHSELSDPDPGNGGGGDGADPRDIYSNPNTRRVRDGRIANRSELSDPGSGSGSDDSIPIDPPVVDPRRGGGTGRGNNEHDDGNGTGDPVRRGGTGRR